MKKRPTARANGRESTRILTLESLEFPVGDPARAHVSVDSEGRSTDTGPLTLEPGRNPVDLVMPIQKSATVKFWVGAAKPLVPAGEVTISAEDSGGIVRLGQCALTYSLTRAG